MTNEGEDFNGYVDGDLAMIKDGSTGVEHFRNSWGDIHKDLITFFAKSGTFYTPTLQVTSDGTIPYFAGYYRNHPDLKLKRFWPDAVLKQFIETPALKDTTHLQFVDFSKNLALLRHAGMKVTVGAHGNLPGIGTHFELWSLQMGGLTNMEALQAATIDGAEGLGMQQDLGSIEVGKIADLVVLDKNPLDDIRNTTAIRYVMKDGILYDGNTLDEVWPEKKKCPPALRLGTAVGSGKFK
jgi:hypothetical protein